MKKLAIALLGIMLCQSALASSKLPFVGKRIFDFHGGTDSGQIITISKNGDVVISPFFDVVGTAYRGKYKKLMCGSNGECYKIIGKNKIAKTDRKGRVIPGSVGGCATAFKTLKTCITDLYRPSF